MKNKTKVVLSSLYGITNPMKRIEDKLTDKKIKFTNNHGYEIIIENKSKKDISKIVKSVFSDLSEESLKALISISEQDKKVYVRQLVKKKDEK